MLWQSKDGKTDLIGKWLMAGDAGKGRPATATIIISRRSIHPMHISVIDH